jgi:surface antigen
MQQSSGDRLDTERAKMRKIISTLVVLCTALCACAQPAQPGEGEPATVGVNKTSGVSQVGAGAGGLIGSQIGASLDRGDQAALHQTTQTALETAPANQALPWRNPNSGNYGTVIQGAVYQNQGQYCREFQQTLVVGGQQQQGDGKACRQPDGSWKVVQ